MDLVRISRKLSKTMDGLRFAAPVTHVYNPLSYAREPHESYLRRFGTGPKEIVLVGMNPGPFGMAQTGVPFGEIAAVRDWMGIDGTVKKPRRQHPKRPITGFECARSEVSGARLWGWARDRFGTAERFFERFFVVNYCPLVFMVESGKNHTPDQLPKSEREPMFEACDVALVEVFRALSPRHIVGVGGFAEKRVKQVLKGSGLEPEVGCVLHPSPASPKANQGWVGHAEADFARMGIEIPQPVAISARA